MLVLAVVVREVNLLHVPVFDGAGKPLAVAIALEAQLGARDAPQSTLLLEDLIGNRVRVHACIRGAAVLRAEYLAPPRPDVEQAHAHQEARAGSLDRGGDDAIGVQLAPS